MTAAAESQGEAEPQRSTTHGDENPSEQARRQQQEKAAETDAEQAHGEHGPATALA